MHGDLTGLVYLISLVCDNTLWSLSCLAAVGPMGDGLQGQVQSAVEALLLEHGNKVASITICGHSLGGALASLCAFDLASSEVNKVGIYSMLCCLGPTSPDRPIRHTVYICTA